MPTSPSRARHSDFDLFAVTAPGLESIAAGELKALGIKGRQETGGVGFEGTIERIYLANLWLRTVSRVIVRLGRFHASTFYELERRAKKLPWSNFLPNAGSVEVPTMEVGFVGRKVDRPRMPVAIALIVLAIPLVIFGAYEIISVWGYEAAAPTDL